MIKLIAVVFKATESCSIKPICLFEQYNCSVFERLYLLLISFCLLREIVPINIGANSIKMFKICLIKLISFSICILCAMCEPDHESRKNRQDQLVDLDLYIAMTHEKERIQQEITRIRARASSQRRRNILQHSRSRFCHDDDDNHCQRYCWAIKWSFLMKKQGCIVDGKCIRGLCKCYCVDEL